MSNKQRIVFSITTIFFTGMMAGIGSIRILPFIYSNFENISTSFKAALLLVLLVYLIEIVLSIIGNYMLLAKNKVNLFLFWLTIIYSCMMSVNLRNFSFIPFDLHISFQYHIADTSFGFGLNFIGILFIIWWIRLKLQGPTVSGSDR